MSAAVLHQKLEERLQTQCDADSTDTEKLWQELRDATYSAGAEVLGFVQRKNQDWFDENNQEITALLQKMYTTHSSYIANKSSATCKSQYFQAKHVVQTKLRQMKVSCWEKKAQELQEAADTHNSKLLHGGLRAVYGPKSCGCTPVRSTDGEKLLTDKAEILTRWAEHFNCLLNRPSSMSEEALDAIPQRQILKDLDLPPLLHEVCKAIKQTSSGKSPGADGIPAEIFKHGGDYMKRNLAHLFMLIWEQG